MTNRQSSVSAIRQQFEFIIHRDTADTLSTRPKYALAPKPECDAVMQKKQPPKTRPKPKMSVVVDAQCGDAVKSTGGVARPVRTVPNVLADRHSCNANDELMGTTGTSVFLLTSSASDPILTTPTESERLSSHVPKRPVRLPGRCVSRDETDIVRSSVKTSAPSRWASACSLLSEVAPCSSDDVKEAIKKAKQKTVLQRIVGMKLEGERLPHEAYRPHAVIADVKTHGKMNGLPSTPVSLPQPDIPTVDDTKPFSVSVALYTGASTIADNESTSAAVTPEPDPLFERSTSSPMSETLSADETSTTNQENGLTDMQSASESTTTQHVAGGQARRPTSLYPLSARTRRPISVTDVSLSTDDNWTTATSPPGSPPSPARLQNAQVSPQTEHLLTANTLNVASAKQPQVAASRQSYQELTEFVGLNFSFLDELDDIEVTEHLSSDMDSWGTDVEPTLASTLTTSTDCSTDQASSATAAGIQDRSDDNEQTAEMLCTNERPKSLLRRSIVLPNGEILEIIGNAFTFLDDYGSPTGDNCT